jgi:hypothetical protein
MRSRLKLTVCCLAAVFLHAAPALAQQVSDIRGVVHDGSGAVVAGATIVVEAAESTFTRLADSARDGPIGRSSFARTSTPAWT